MNDSFQDVYAKHLQHADYGYPLRKPEPMSTLPQSYQQDGLQIGDVGIVDSNGQFDVLFNICKRDDNPLHRSRGVPINFKPVQRGNVKSSDNAISAGPIHSHGIKQVLQPSSKPRSADYEFDCSTPAGAILLLPHGAESVELLSQEQFREEATKSALDWHHFAQKCYGVQRLDRSLYLITGFYKARFWSLGSYNNPTDTPGKIVARKDDNNPNIYILESEFPADRRHSRGGDDSGSNNQTVFIAGFKITASSWVQDPIVVPVTESVTMWFQLVHLLKSCLKRLRGLSGGHKQHAVISMEHQPKLSQPFHPSDVINRFLLNKNPSAKVAITHDSQWMDMMKKGLTHEDLQEDRFETFLTRCYDIDLERENTIVLLRDKGDDTLDPVPPVVDPQDPSPELEVDSLTSKLDVSAPPTPELDISPSTTPEPEVPSPSTSEPGLSVTPTCSFDNPRIVITRIRARNIFSGLRRIPAGFYVLVHFDECRRRTQNKCIQSNGSGIEWEDEILLPSKASDVVRFTVYASFELEPTLGNGEALYTSESRVEELAGGTYLMVFSPGKPGTTARGPSLLITLGRWYTSRLEVTPSDDDSNLDSEESSNLVRETNSGQKALLDYLNEYQSKDLETAIQHFERAWRDCPITHCCRAVVLVNLAKAKFIKFQIDPTGVNLDDVVQLYRQALNLRPSGRPDRPATLLQFAQTLLYCYEKQGHDESVADVINKSMTELQNLSKDSHEHRAANLVLETLKRCRVVNSGVLAELDALVLELKHCTIESPDGHFDRPQRLVNLSTVMWRRYESRGERSDLDQSLEISKQALQLLPGRHPDRLPVLRALSAMLWGLFELSCDINCLRELAEFGEEALQLIPERHPERPYWVSDSISCRAEMSEYLGDKAFQAENYDEAVVHYSEAIELRTSLL